MLLREQVVLAWGRCRVVGMTKRWGLGTVFQDPTAKVCCGGVLLSHTLPGAVPSALAGLASRFGMGAGRFPAAMTTTSWFNHILLKVPPPVCAARVRAGGGLCWL